AAVTCSHDTDVLCRGLNAQLPAGVRVRSVAEAASDFHARFSARSKTYRYLLRNGPLSSPFERQTVWQVTDQLDLDAMALAAARLTGTHRFARSPVLPNGRRSGRSPISSTSMRWPWRRRGSPALTISPPFAAPAASSRA